MSILNGLDIVSTRDFEHAEFGLWGFGIALLRLKITAFGFGFGLRVSGFEPGLRVFVLGTFTRWRVCRGPRGLQSSRFCST